MTLNSNSGAKKFPEIGWGQSLHATPNQRRDAVDNALWVGEPVKDIPHIFRDPAKPIGMRSTRRAAVRRTLSRHLTRQVGSPSYIALYTVIEARYYKGMNKGRCSSWGEGAGHHPRLPKLVVTAAAKKINMPDNQSINQYRFIGEYTNIPLLTQLQQGYDTKYLP